jgi:uncharacterized membrane protein (UPF0127 family)
MSKTNQLHSASGNKNVRKSFGRKPTKLEIIGIIAVFTIAIILLFSNVLQHKPKENQYVFRKDGELSFVDSTGKSLTKIDIQIAANDFDRELGLMYRKSMGMKQGMLFIFPEESIQSFWMRNTEISLDMIFVNKGRKIVTIHKNTTRLSDQTYKSTKPAEYVIEVDAGFCDNFNIKVGDKITWKRTD